MINNSTYLHYLFKVKEKPTEHSIITMNAIVAIYEHYYNSLRILREFTETYNTDGLVRAHQNIWLIIKKCKMSLK